MANEDVSAALEALQRKFAASLEEKISGLEQLLGQCADGYAARGSLPADSLREAHRAAHSLAGSGGTFGFAELGEAARKLEDMLAARLNGETPSDAPDLPAVMKAFAAVAIASKATPARALARVSSARKTEVARGHRLIYLVEDDATTAANLAAQLSHFGYQVRVFGSPREIRRGADNPMPSAVIMDVGFPEGPLAGPRAVAGALREEFLGVPVLFISARGDFGARLEALRAGGVAYFTKPVDICAVINALDGLPGQTILSAYRVLIVDDSESTAAFYQHVLAAAGMDARSIQDPSLIIDALADFSPDLILMDVYMPVCSGIELAALIRQQPGFVGIPIVFLSVETNTNRQLVALRHGGDDFLSKPIDPPRLVSVITSRAARARVLRANMATDGLTGLLNHSHLKDQLENEIVRAQRQGRPLAYAMIDVDHFKQVNDTWGHAMGDRVLRGLAQLLRQRLRRTDVAGRYGGEEFGLILTDVDAAVALSLLDDIRGDFGELRLAGDEGDVSITFSAGIAEFPRHGTADSLIAAADAALYVAKKAGRNRIVVDGAA